MDQPYKPELPVELERQIFEIAALARLQDIPSLMLVACRVKQWVEPLLYRIVMRCPALKMPDFPIFTAKTMLEKLENKPHDFFERSVKQLFIDCQMDPSETIPILAPCRNATNLFANFEVLSAHFPVLHTFHFVRFLAVEIKALIRSAPIDLIHTLFQNVTHLELLDRDDMDFGEWRQLGKRLCLVPNLTHVAFNWTLHRRVSQPELCADKRLLCVAFLSTQQNGTPPDDGSPLANDPRFVFLVQTTNYAADWLHGALNGDDYWALADTFIARRRAGKIDAKIFTVADTDDWWKE
ncbi:hypothetical protein DFH06DRAFT_358135 [Mycena polygramma]|nr:hypothetical protein DFH06DRAFT_358135 [Mycena polygramma]